MWTHLSLDLLRVQRARLAVNERKQLQAHTQTHSVAGRRHTTTSGCEVQQKSATPESSIDEAQRSGNSRRSSMGSSACRRRWSSVREAQSRRRSGRRCSSSQYAHCCSHDAWPACSSRALVISNSRRCPDEFASRPASWRRGSCVVRCACRAPLAVSTYTSIAANQSASVSGVDAELSVEASIGLDAEQRERSEQGRRTAQERGGAAEDVRERSQRDS